MSMNFKQTSDRVQGGLQYRIDEDDWNYRLLDMFNRSNIFTLDIGFPTDDYNRVRMYGNVNSEYSISFATEHDTDFIMATLVAHDEDEGEYEEAKLSMKFALEDLVEFFIDNENLRNKLEWKLKGRMRD